MTDWFQVICMVAATPMVLFWCFLYLKYQHTFDDYIKTLSKDDYKMPELFFIGMGFMNQIHYNLHSKQGQRRIKEISEVKGKKYAEYYYYIDRGAIFTYLLTFAPLTVLLTALADNAQMLIIGVCVLVLLIRYLENEINDRLQERREELLMDLPQVLSKMALLINSGMVMREAWVKASAGGERAIYQEMRITSAEIANGASDFEAFRNFADRCSIKQIRKMVSTLLQNMEKGNQELAYFMDEMSKEMWEEKKNLVKQKGEAAGTKLMVPTAMIFMGILILIVVPVIAESMGAF